MKNGTIQYDGKWENNEMSGKGKLYYKSGNVEYDGKFKNGQRYGPGK
jgi:antitoxin component YwqK of YwqJK toxin-antitoxin module